MDEMRKRLTIRALLVIIPLILLALWLLRK